MHSDTHSPNTNGHSVSNEFPNGYGVNERAGFQLGDFSIDDPRPIKVIVIGAGYSGIIAGIRFSQRIPNLDLTIYEAQAGVGGTWFANKYPGLACDIPSHCYQLTFEENPNWSSFYAPGPEILAYLEGVVSKYKLMRYIKLQHTLVRAQWDESKGKWILMIRKPRLATTLLPNPSIGPPLREFEYEEFEDAADVLVTAFGTLSRWSWPDIAGLENFSGTLIHTAQWETGEYGNGGWEESVKGWGEKRVGVIGVGSSAIQVVPALQPKVKQLINYVRGKTWLSTPFLGEKMKELANQEGADIGNYKFTQDEKEKFKDPEYYRKFRRELESELNSVHPATLRNSPMQMNARAAFRESMLHKLAKKPWIANHLIPDFSVACRRLTPGPGYLEALCEDNVDFVTTIIDRITPTGIQTVDGKHQELDVIICATGFDASGQLPFPIVGRNGVTLQSKYSPYPRTYLSIAVDGFPNWFQAFGPNSGVGAGSLLIVLERQVDYIVEAILKLQRERLKSIEIRKQAVDDFDEYLEAYFPTSVFGEKCRSWYKMGKEEGRVVALWPGSSLHILRVLEHPRWEDYIYEHLDGVKNRFYWFGDGVTACEKDPNDDRAWYLSERDIPPVPTD